MGLIDVINKKPKNKDRMLGIKITERFDMPEIFMANISSDLFIFLKNQIPDNNIRKGNIW